MSQFRSDFLTCLLVLPLINAVGHLFPVLGSAWAVAGDVTINPPVLLLSFSSWMILDVYDKYKDMPREMRPQQATFVAWISIFFIIAVWSTYSCGWDVAICILRLLWLELLWPTPSIPTYSRKEGFKLMKLKSILGPGKSVFCGVLAGLMDTQASTVYTCSHHPHRCVAQYVPRKAMAYGALYSFVRETVFDARDIVEDIQHGVQTLPTTIGMRGTKVLLGLSTAVGEFLIARDKLILSSVMIRMTFTIGLMIFALEHPRSNSFAWALFCASSLIPAFLAQIEMASVSQL